MKAQIPEGVLLDSKAPKDKTWTDWVHSNLKYTFLLYSQENN